MSLPAEDLFTKSKQPETVSQLTGRIKRLLEDHIRSVTVTGEISNWRANPSGHFYYVIKDEGAQIPAVLWRSGVSRLKFEPENGMQVVVHGKVEVYAPHGKYQLIVDRMEPAGLGALQLKFEQLKQKLEKEGLFDAARKRPLPPYPSVVAIVTSPTGAAVADMLRILTSRWPKVHALVYPVRVQGEGAAPEIAAAIDHLNRERPDVDVMIVGRGGGSIEDLWAFNEEAVARAIFKSAIPVVSAVGHEIDFTIADFVADVRAATPTDAATKVVPEYSAVMEMLEERRAALLRAPESMVRQRQQQVDDFVSRLAVGLENASRTARRTLDQWKARIVAASPTEALKRQRRDLDRLASSANSAVGRSAANARQRLDSAKGHLEAVSPLAVLKRGYSVTLDKAGHVITDPAQVKPGDRIRSRVHRGTIDSDVADK